MKHIPMGRRKSLTEGPKGPRGRKEPDSTALPPARAASGRSAIDLFIDRGLHELYDNMLTDPVPDELFRLIEDDRKK